MWAGSGFGDVKKCSKRREKVSIDTVYSPICTTDALRKIMYEDDLVIVAEHWEELQGAPEEWNEMFKKHGLKMNLDKTETCDVGWETERGVTHQVGRERH